MLRMSLPWILQVMSSIVRLDKIQRGTKALDAWYPCNDAKSRIEELFEKSIFTPHLKISREKASQLIACLEDICEVAASGSDEDEIQTIHYWTLQNRRTQFIEVFLSELNIFPTFLVMGKEGYETNTLIDEGHKLFPSSTVAKCPEAATDMSEAGKALAFELATSCGFHIFRATEAVIKRYWDHISQGQPRPKMETIGSYAKELENNRLGDEKIWEALKQLATLHRNPVIHPDVILTVEEAIDILGIARSVMSGMLRMMPEILPTTASPSSPDSH